MMVECGTILKPNKNMKFNNRENEKITSSDGREFWISRSVAVCATIIGIRKIDTEEAFVLVEQRGPDLDFPGKWCLPCGYLDWDESGPEAIRREIWEECNLNLNSILEKYPKLYNCMSREWRVSSNPNDSNRQNVTLHYGVVFNTNGEELPEVKSTNLNEISLAGWQSINLIDSLDWAFNHNSVVTDFMDHFIDFSL